MNYELHAKLSHTENTIIFHSLLENENIYTYSLIWVAPYEDCSYQVLSDRVTCQVRGWSLPMELTTSAVCRKSPPVSTVINPFASPQIQDLHVVLPTPVSGRPMWCTCVGGKYHIMSSFISVHSTKFCIIPDTKCTPT